MKRSSTAFLLSFFLPGLGLVYVGRNGAAIANLVVAFAVPLAACWLWPETVFDFIHYVALAIAAGSGGLAHAVAARQARRAASSPA